MLPGVGIFGSEPIAKILVDLLEHFKFNVHGIWTNHHEIESGSYITSNSEIQKLITTKIDNVLLNKNINLVFVCCQPNFHSQISSKALGIGKNVICFSPTCKNIDDIAQMINSAHYYPTLISSIAYGGLTHVSEFKLLKESLTLIGEIKFCNIIVNCQNLAVVRHENTYHDLNSSQRTSNQAMNWLTDYDLGAGVLNRFGAAMISLVLSLFDGNRVTKVAGNLRTMIEDLKSPVDTNSLKTRKITADDHCTFQMCLEPSSIVVNVVINSLAQCKYSQEMIVSGNDASLVWNNSNLTLRTSTHNKNTQISKIIQKNLPQTDCESKNRADFEFIETHLTSEKQNTDEEFLNKYMNFELKHPEMPFIFIRGLYAYISKLKENFQQSVINDPNNNINSNESLKQSHHVQKFNFSTNLDSFEHTRIVQTIIKGITSSSDKKQWVSINY